MKNHCELSVSYWVPGTTMGTGCIRIFFRDALFFHFCRMTDVDYSRYRVYLVEKGSCRYKAHVLSGLVFMYIKCVALSLSLYI